MSHAAITANQTRLAIPSDGKGGLCTLLAASNAANTTYGTDTVDGNVVPTATDANATPWNQAYQGHPAGSFAGIVAGGMAVTTDGFYGVVKTTTAPGTITLREPWRHMTDPAKDGQLPAAAGQCAVFSASILAGCRARGLVNFIRRIAILLKTGAGDATFQILTGGGAVLFPATTVKGATAPAFTMTPHDAPLGAASGLPFRGPFGVLCSDGSINMELFFDLNG